MILQTQVKSMKTNSRSLEFFDFFSFFSFFPLLFRTRVSDIYFFLEKRNGEENGSRFCG